jgi:ACDE family multidrug resistance protein
MLTVFVMGPRLQQKKAGCLNLMEENKKWDLISIASIPLVMTLGNSMLIPILPAIRSKLGVTSLQVSLLITIYSAVAIILIPVAGYFSDRLGRKKIIIPSLLITGVGGLISGLAAWWMDHSYMVILLGRVLQGIGASGAFPIALPLVGDIFKKENEISSSLGVVETANTFGKVLSPIIGSALAMVVWFLPFLVIPAFCLISVLLVAFLVKSPPQKTEEKTPFTQFLRRIKQIFVDNGNWLYAIFTIGCICMLVIFSTLFYLSDMLEDNYQIVGILKGCILAIPLTFLCLASYLTGKWVGRNKSLMKWLTFTGMAVGAVCLLLSGIVQSIILLITWVSLAGTGIGIALPCMDAMITDGIEKQHRGTITSIYSSMRFIGVAIGPPLASFLVTVSPLILFYSISALCGIAAILAIFAIKPTEEKSPSTSSKLKKARA